MIKFDLTGIGRDLLISLNAISRPVSFTSFVAREAQLLLKQNRSETQTYLYCSNLKLLTCNAEVNKLHV